MTAQKIIGIVCLVIFASAVFGPMIYFMGWGDFLSLLVIACLLTALLGFGLSSLMK